MEIHEHIVRLLTQSEKPDVRYFWITLLIGESGKPEWGIQTQWSGFTEDRPRREIREGRLYHAEHTRSSCEQYGESVLIINDADDIKYFYLFGGHALIAEDIGRVHFPGLVAPHVSLRDSIGLGFRFMSSLSESELQHAPSKKLRMNVIVRDSRKCSICGRAPRHYVDVELHVHHAIPWGQGGITEERNLITLCQTCHDGLDPHYDPTLSAFLNEKYKISGRDHSNALNKYHEWLRARFSK